MLFGVEPDVVDDVIKALKKHHRNQLRLSSPDCRRLLQPFTKTAVAHIEQVPTVNVDRLMSAFPNLSKVILSTLVIPDSYKDYAADLSAFFVSGSDAAGKLIALDLHVSVGYAALAVVAVSCSRLQQLAIKDAEPSACRAIQSLVSLQNLEVQGKDITAADVQAIGNLTGLERLTVNATRFPFFPSQLHHLEPLAKLTALSLNLDHLDGLTSIAQLTKLQSLSLFWEQEGDDEALSPLSSLQQLTYLSTQQTSAADLPFLFSLTGLHSLSCGLLSTAELTAVLQMRFLTSLTTDRESLDAAYNENQQDFIKAAQGCGLQSLFLHCSCKEEGEYEHDLPSFSFPALQSFGNDALDSSLYAPLLVGSSELRCLWLQPAFEVNPEHLARTLSSPRLSALQALFLSHRFFGDDDDLIVIKAMASLPSLSALLLVCEGEVDPFALQPLARNTSLRELFLLCNAVDRRLLATLALAPAMEVIKVLHPSMRVLELSQADCDAAVEVAGKDVEIVIEVCDDDSTMRRLWCEVEQQILRAHG